MAVVEKLGVGVFVEGLSKFTGDMKTVDDLNAKNFKSFEQTATGADDLSDSMDDVTGSAEKLADETDKAGDSAGKTDKSFKLFGLSLTDIKSGISIVTGGIREFAQAAEKALEFGEMGAVARQVEESFERTRRELGLSADMIDQMREAVNYTIPRQELMASAQTLVAGTSKEFGAALLQNLPQLAEYAKASNKLNPALGDTSFLLESIALGLKRGSPMILDNLGLVVKVGDANEAWAKILGKTVAELTAEEKQMALLNDVMRAGDRLIEQVGGSTKSLVDQYAQLTAATADAKTEVAKLFSEFVDLTGVTEQVTRATLRLSFENAIKEASELNLITDEQIKLFRAHQDEGHGLIATEEEIAASFEITAAALDELNRIMDMAVKEQEREIATFDRLTEVMIKNQSALTDLGHTTFEVTEEMKAALQASEQWRLTTVSATSDKGLASEKNIEVSDTTSQLTDEMIKAREAEDELAEATRIFTQEALAEAEKRLKDYNTEMGKLFISALDAEEQETNLTVSLFEAAKAAGVGATELALLAAATGDYTDVEIEAALKTAIMQDRIEKLAGAVANGKLTVEEALKKLKKFNEEADKIPTKKTFTLEMKVTGKLPDISQFGGGQVQQFGGPVMGGRPLLVGERGPEIFIPGGGGQIVPNTSIVNNKEFNLTSQSVMRDGGLEMEFEVMEMAGR